MTVTSTTTKTAALPGNSSTFTYSFAPMVVYASTNIVVTKTTVTGGAEETLTEGTGANNYSVNITTYPATGSITYPADQVTPMTSSFTLTIKRVLPISQTIDLTNQGGYFPDTQETIADKGTIVDLQQQEVLDRSLTLPVSVTGVSVELPVPSALTGLRWNATATAIENGSGDTTVAIPVSVVQGGTGSTTAGGARTALGVVIGTDVQAFDAELAAVAGLTSADNKIIQFTGTGTAKVIDYLDDDTMAANSAEAVVSQQSIVAYITAQGVLPTGTVLLFYQETVPTGWTRVTTAAIDKHALVIDTQTALGSFTGTKGGANAFATAFNGTIASGSHAGTAPAHTHDLSTNWFNGGSAGADRERWGSDSSDIAAITKTTASGGAGGSHTHVMDLQVAYINLFLASKN